MVADFVSELETDPRNRMKDFKNMVSKLALTDKEKDILLGIIEDKRQGTLHILTDKGRKPVAELRILNREDMPNFDLYNLLILLPSLLHVKDLAIEFST